MRLRRVDCSGPGFTRRRRGRGFEYFSASGDKIVDEDVLERIRDLAIPPAWGDVWICPVPNGHLEAVGVDAAGRRQYRYHDLWRQRRDAEKFDQMLDFAPRSPACARCARRYSTAGRTWAASGCWPLPCACSTTGCSGSGGRRAPPRRSRSG